MMSAIRSLGLYMLVLYAFVIHYGLLKFNDPVVWAGNIVYLIAAYYLAVRLLNTFLYGVLFSRTDLIAVILLAACWVPMLYNLNFRPEAFDYDGLPAIIQVRNHLVFGMIWMLVGAAVSLHRAKRSDIVSLLLVAALAFAIFSGVRSTEGLYTIRYDRLTVAQLTSDEKVTHLTFAYFATILYALSYGYAKRLRPIIFVLGAIVVFPLESRSAFFITPVAILAFEFLSGNRRSILRLALPLIVAGVVAFSIQQSGIIDFGDDRNQRMVFAEGVEFDDSAEVRSNILARSLKELPAQALVGDPTFMVTEFGDLGAFIHNLLSAWQYFGLFAFLCFVFALWTCYRRTRVFSRRGELDPVKAMGVIVLLYIIMGISTTHFVAHRLLWFSLGFWLLQLPPTEEIRSRGSGLLLKGFGLVEYRRRKRRKRKRRHRRTSRV